MPTAFSTVPGQTRLATVVPRNIFYNMSPAQTQWLSTRGQVNGQYSRDPGSNDEGGAAYGGTTTYTPSVLRAGNLCGLMTTAQQYRPSVTGLLQAAIGTHSTTIQVAQQVGIEFSRLLLQNGSNTYSFTILGPSTTNGSNVYEAVTATGVTGTTSTTVTFTPQTTNAYVVGSLLQPNDGSQNPITILNEPYGIDVTDLLGNSINQNLTPAFVRGGDMRSSMLIDFVADDFGTTTEPSCQAWLKAQLRAEGGSYTFNTDRV